MQIYSTLGMTNIDDLVNNIFSVFDRLDVSTIEGREIIIVVSGSKLLIKITLDL